MEKSKMWAHFCRADSSVVSNPIGEPCNWCDAQLQVGAQDVVDDLTVLDGQDDL